MSKIIEFNNHQIPLLQHLDQWLVPIVPVLEAFDLEYEDQMSEIRTHDIHRSLLVVDDVLYIPEEFIYGFIFLLNSDHPEIIKHKMQYYEVLYNYFHQARTVEGN